MVPCVSPKWKLTVSNHIWSICAEKFFFDVLNHFSFPDFCTNDFLFCRLFPSLYFRLLKLFSSGWEILFWFQRWIWLLNACVLFDQSHDFSLFVLQFLVTAVLGIVFISRPSLFHFASRILVIFIASWMIFLEIGFFMISFLTRWYFVFKEMALSWELIFFLNFVA